MYRPRVRETGLQIGSLPCGPLNAITDVGEVRVGHVSLLEGEGPLIPGKGPIRTGVTAILPHPGNIYREPVTAAVHVFNGFAKATGLIQIEELGELETPILITSTLNVPRVADGLISWVLRENREIGISGPTVNPVVAECHDGYLNDAQGRHVREEHVFAAIEGAKGGLVEEGTVGAGVGTACYGFKGGVGTSSRLLPEEAGGFRVGVLVVTNMGRREDLLIAGVPVGRLLSQREPPIVQGGSVVIVLATDAFLDPTSLKRVARRCPIGLARTGWTGGYRSGDLVIAFTTTRAMEKVDPEVLNHLFRAAEEATEEAVLNSLFRATTLVGRDGHLLEALPLEETLALLHQAGRLSPPPNPRT
ncbi:MAG: P1 family peptidase [Armatimonadota bacterium]|nr:P1 family peptidase [Armatimonadota bacterium]MDR5703654.1 P1 family peptidase [Armatimonadota bacterium]MDR7434630.1 P1 family peptidase [Armatimonadota bacterium]